MLHSKGTNVVLFPFYFRIHTSDLKTDSSGLSLSVICIPSTRLDSARTPDNQGWRNEITVLKLKTDIEFIFSYRGKSLLIENGVNDLIQG